MENRKRLINQVNYVTRSINDGKIKDKSVIELITIIKNYDTFMQRLIEEVESDNIHLSLEQGKHIEVLSNYRIRLNALGISEFQFLTFQIQEAWQHKGNIKNFFINHKKNIKNGLRAAKS